MIHGFFSRILNPLVVLASSPLVLVASLRATTLDSPGEAGLARALDGVVYYSKSKHLCHSELSGLTSATSTSNVSNINW